MDITEYHDTDYEQGRSPPPYRIVRIPLMIQRESAFDYLIQISRLEVEVATATHALQESFGMTFPVSPFYDVFQRQAITVNLVFQAHLFRIDYSVAR